MKDFRMAGPLASLGLALFNLKLTFEFGLGVTNGSLLITVAILVGGITAIGALSDTMLRKTAGVAVPVNLLVFLLCLLNVLTLVMAFDGSMSITTLIAAVGVVPVAFTLAALKKLDE